MAAATGKAWNPNPRLSTTSEVLHSCAVVSAMAFSGVKISSKGREKAVVPAGEEHPHETS